MNIVMKTIPHSWQRYPTVGDWIARRGKLREVLVSDMKNEDYAFLIMVHELVEAYLCLKRGVAPKDVDAFDMAFEARRVKGNEEEPGDDPQAPYHREHQFATKIEKLVAKEMGVDWKAYDKAVVAL